MLCGLSTSTMRGTRRIRSIRNSLVPFALAGAFQSPKRFSSSGIISASVLLPATKMVALSGRIQLSWKAVRSARVTALTPLSVPDPVKGMP